MSFLLDTDICSAHLKGNRAVGNRFLQYTGGLHVSTVTLGELYTWAFRATAPPRRLPALEELVGDMTVLDVSHDVARKSARFARHCWIEAYRLRTWTC